MYCDQWSETVDFYREILAFPVSFENEWFVEFAVHGDATLSVADASRATIAAGGGDGITLSWRVVDLAAARVELLRRGVETTPVTPRWGAITTMFSDPAGTRIELWANVE